MAAEISRNRSAGHPARAIRTRRDIASGMEYLLGCDPRLHPIAEIAGEVPLRRASPGLGGLVGIVISQQVSVASAGAIEARLLALIDPLTPQNLLGCGEDVFRQAGLSRPKQRTLRNVAEAVDGGVLDLAAIVRKPVEEAMAELTAIKGIGPWTAEIYLLFCAGHPDIFPAGDLALQEAVRLGLAMRKRPDEKRLRAIAEKWQPWRGVAARLFWSYYRMRKNGREALPV
jgi:DNA-3-methyladenine glycosylase II